MPLLDPRNDYVFKRLFTAVPALLSNLINTIRAGEPPIRIDQIRNPHIAPEQLTGKFIALDVLATDAAGAHYDVELQVRWHAGWPRRSTYYLARTLVDQLHSGEDYDRILPTIGIYLMGFDMFPDLAQARWWFEIRDRDQPGCRLTEALQWNMIELPKADRLLAGRRSEALAAWVAFFQHAQDETVMSTITHPPVRQALDELQRLSADEQARHDARLRERALLDERAFVKEAKAEGHEEGRDEGRKEERVEILLSLLRHRFGELPEAVLARVQAGTAADLGGWTLRVLDARTLDAVFVDDAAT